MTRPYEGHEYEARRVLVGGRYRNAKKVVKTLRKRGHGGRRVQKEQWEKGSRGDSVSYRYARTFIFQPTNESEKTDLANNPARFLSSYLHLFATTQDKDDVVEMYGRFENYVRKWHSTRAFGVWLSDAAEQLKDFDEGKIDVNNHSNRLDYLAPDVAIIVAYGEYLRRKKVSVFDAEENEKVIHGRDKNFGGTKLHMSAISTTMHKFSGVGINYKDPRMATSMKDWEKDSTKKSKPPFDMAADLELFHQAIVDHPTKERPVKLRLTAQSVTQMGAIGRASDVTKKFCPKNRDVKWPQSPDEYFSSLNQDGTKSSMPMHVDMALLNWKWRNRRLVGKKYWIRFHANRVKGKAQFSIPHVIWTWQSYLKANDLYDDDEPLFPGTADTYETHLKDIFNHMAVISGDDKYKKYSSHSIRYGATQWARRCGADFNIIRRVGRWSDLVTMMEYLTEREADVVLVDGVDPVWKIWRFNSCTVGDSIEFPNVLN